MRTTGLLAPVLLACAAPLCAATKISLNGEWQFAIPGGTPEAVVVPHTWNIGKYADHEGTATYTREFAAPDGVRGKHVELHFGATFYKSRVWLNGVELGGHEGGYTAYYFDITPHLKPRNTVKVELNNEPGFTTIPGYAMKLRGGGNVWYDWWHYGGIVRDVWLSVSEPVLIRRQQIRTRVDGRAAEITTRVFVENHTNSPRDVTLRVRSVFDQSNIEVAGVTRRMTIAPGNSDTSVAFQLERPAMWDFDHPNLYRVEAELIAGDTLLDAKSDNIGIRRIEFRDRKLYLNGEPVRLTGMTRHEESPWEGLAETRGTMKHDYDEMKELQVTLTRPVHYPQHPYILDYCDRNGILLIPEIPMWQFSEEQMQNPQVLALAKRMIQEMIEEAYNHPSILGWSVCNESATNTPGGRAYFDTMYAHVKTLDPDRYISYADDQISSGADPKINAASVADFIMMNQYFGTWHGPAANLVPTLERVGREYPTKTVIISEFGAAGMFGPDKTKADELRAQIIRDQMDTFSRFDFIAGAIFWCYQDYKSHRNLRPGFQAGQVEMGIVDENRQRYPSFYVWQRRNAPAHLTLTWNYKGATPTGLRLVLQPRAATEIPSYGLSGYQLTWEVRGFDGKLLSSGSRGVGDTDTVDAPLSGAAPRALRATVRLIRPTGFTAAEETLDYWEGLSGGYDIPDMEKAGKKIP